MKKVEIFDISTKKRFTTDKYEIEKQNGRFRVVAVSPHCGKKVGQFISREKAQELMH